MDGTTISAFLRTWAAIAAGSLDRVMQAECTAASTLFPESKVMPPNARVWIGTPFVKPGRSSPRRFLFDSKALSTLKDLARSESVSKPTRIEALTGFIWKHAMGASRKATSVGSPSALVHSVNLRRRTKPSLPEHAVGNIDWKAFAVHDSLEAEAELPRLVEPLRRLIAEIDGDLMKKIWGETALVEVSKWLGEVKEIYERAKHDCYTFVNWCNMGFNDVDFGWGRPAWVSLGNFGDEAFRNLVILVDAPSGDGIEAWIVLEEREMVPLERDPKFLAFASPRSSA
ncbi:BAHD acyltransferase At5g47980-like [Eucalyptus grandis]|uniref:BAHD acyltransferase At5g47980-like n=1 Tax=Eucalyptus grandis TaxID=71139 RepID=UPI00192EB08A|nr:BAHD acyltransferase At5g47980-like [Eucalyptus grandis]